MSRRPRSQDVTSGPLSRSFPPKAPLGAASALKMPYAGINKGTTLLAAAMLLGATRAGAADALRSELSESRPELLDRYARSIPDMYPKAYRWASEMEEIAEFLGDDPAARLIFQGMAALCRRLAADQNGGQDPVSGGIYGQADRASLKAPCVVARDSRRGQLDGALKYAATTPEFFRPAPHRYQGPHPRASVGIFVSIKCVLLNEYAMNSRL